MFYTIFFLIALRKETETSVHFFAQNVSFRKKKTVEKPMSLDN